MNAKPNQRQAAATISRPRRVVTGMLAALAAALAANGSGCAPQPPEGVTILFNGKDLTGWKVLKKGYYDAAGKVHVKDGRLMLDAGQALTGVAWAGAVPTADYEVELEAMRVTGEDFFCGLTFPIGKQQATLIVGGWGGQVVGLSNVDDLSAAENETTKIIAFEKGRWYHIRLRVAQGRIRVWIENDPVIDLATAKRRFDVWPQQEAARPLGITSWYTGSALRNVLLRRLGD